MRRDNELIVQIIQNELTRFKFLFSSNEKLMIKNGDFLDLATEQLEKLALFFWLFAALIVLVSGLSVYLLIDHGQTASTFSLILGLVAWVGAMFLTYLFAKEIIVKKRSMQMIIDLLNK